MLYRAENIDTGVVLVIGSEEFCQEGCNFSNANLPAPKFRVVPHVIGTTANSLLSRSQIAQVLSRQPSYDLVKIKLPEKKTVIEEIQK